MKWRDLTESRHFGVIIGQSGLTAPSGLKRKDPVFSFCLFPQNGNCIFRGNFLTLKVPPKMVITVIGGVGEGVNDKIHWSAKRT